MSENEEDIRRLLDILGFVSHLEQIIEGHDRASFEENIAVTYATERLLHNIGEATAYVSEGLKLAHSEISWGKIRGMRNILAHGYDVLDHDTLWDTVQVHIDKLKNQIQKILKETGG